MNSSLPEAFIQRLKSFFPDDNIDSLLKGYETLREPTIRVNTLKININEFLNEMNKSNIKPQFISWIKNAFRLSKLSTRELTDQELYKKGGFYIQSLSSMIPALILDPTSEDTVLDMAAAPGSKTTQMAAMMKNKGKIVANDNSRTRIFKLKQNIEIQGVINTEVKTLDGQSIWKKYPEYFDKVLLDAPCSMEGTFNVAKPESFAYWSEKRIKQFSKLQKWLLRSAISAAKPGAIIVYSTCTLSPEENEDVIDWILKKEKGNVQLEVISIKELKAFPAFLSYKQKTFHPDLQKCLRILPSSEMEGFFVAKLRKTRSTVKRSSL